MVRTKKALQSAIEFLKRAKEENQKLQDKKDREKIKAEIKEKKRKELKEICSKVGKLNKITEKNINCLTCKGINKYKEDEYMEAICKLIEKDKEYGK